MAIWKRLHREVSFSDKMANAIKKGGHIVSTVWGQVLPWSDSWGTFPRDLGRIRGVCLNKLALAGLVRDEQVSLALQALTEFGLLHDFTAGGKAFIVFHDHADHQPTTYVSKGEEFPRPPMDLCECIGKSASLEEAKPKPRVKALQRPSQGLSYSPSPSESAYREGGGAEEETQGGIGAEVPDSALAGCKTGPVESNGAAQHLMAVARKAKTRGEPHQVRNFVEGVEASKGGAFVEKLLMDHPGAHVWDLEKLLRQQPAQSPAAEKREREKRCGKCRGAKFYVRCRINPQHNGPKASSCDSCQNVRCEEDVHAQ